MLIFLVLRQNLWVEIGALSFPNGMIVLSLNDQPGEPNAYQNSTQSVGKLQGVRIRQGQPPEKVV